GRYLTVGAKTPQNITFKTFIFCIQLKYRYHGARQRGNQKSKNDQKRFVGKSCGKCQKYNHQKQAARNCRYTYETVLKKIRNLVITGKKNIEGHTQTRHRGNSKH